MDKMVKRITLVKRGGGEPEVVEVYRDQEKKGRRRVSSWARPIERAARKLLESEIAFGDEALRRHNKANERRRDGWILDAPVTLIESGRRAYNEARKADPFRILPKA
jgi:hypothetical protein